jgi:probable phosphoglycerate mutase
LLARHGETAWNAIGRMQGHTDIELNDRGRAQARALAATLASSGVMSVWSSDLARAHETAAIVASDLGLAAPRTDAELRERRFGVFEGLTRDECIARYPDEWRAWTGARIHPPGSESRVDATARMHRAITRVHDGASGAVLVVTHGGVMRLWLTELLNTAIPPIGNAAVYTVEHDGTEFRARAHGAAEPSAMSSSRGK